MSSSIRISAFKNIFIGMLWCVYRGRELILSVVSKNVLFDTFVRTPETIF
jgi:hypothetical protein